MKSKLVLILVALLVTLPAIVYAEGAPVGKSGIIMPASTGEVVDAENKLCPVSGDPVSGKDFVVYDGKRYGLCCPMCEKKFNADPITYIEKLETMEKSAVKGG